MVLGVTHALSLFFIRMLLCGSLDLTTRDLSAIFRSTVAHSCFFSVSCVTKKSEICFSKKILENFFSLPKLFKSFYMCVFYKIFLVINRNSFISFHLRHRDELFMFIFKALAMDPDAVLMLSLGLGAVVECVYVWAKRKGWAT